MAATTDFFQISAFDNVTQIISIYYLVIATVAVYGILQAPPRSILPYRKAWKK